MSTNYREVLNIENTNNTSRFLELEFSIHLFLLRVSCLQSNRKATAKNNKCKDKENLEQCLQRSCELRSCELRAVFHRNFLECLRLDSSSLLLFRPKQ